MWAPFDLACPSCHRAMLIRELAINELAGMTYVAVCPACEQSFRTILDVLMVAAQIGRTQGYVLHKEAKA